MDRLCGGINPYTGFDADHEEIVRFLDGRIEKEIAWDDYDDESGPEEEES